MCIVIDSCTIASVFNSTDICHDEFKPVLDWISFGAGKMIFGGSKYKQELNKLPCYIKIIKELEKAGRCIIIDEKRVDDIQNDIEKKYSHRNFDDTHIVAIIIASRIRLICTNEKRAIPWYKKKELYPQGLKRPKLYTSRRNRTLLKKKYIVNICSQKANKPLHLTEKRGA